MAIGTGIPISAFQSGKTDTGSIQDALGDISRNPTGTGENSRDSVNLSRESLDLVREGQQALRNLQQIDKVLDRQDREFTLAQLREIRERVDFTRQALRNAGSEQRDVILGQLTEIVGDLSGIGRRLAGRETSSSELSVATSSTQVSAISGSLSIEFSAAIERDGVEFSVAEELNVEFSFLRVSSSQQNIEISSDQEGVSIEASSQSQDLLLSNVSVSRESSILVNTSNGNLGSLASNEVLQEFREAIADIGGLVNDIQKKFGIEEIPEPFMDFIKGLVTSHLEESLSGPLVLDESV